MNHLQAGKSRTETEETGGKISIVGATARHATTKLRKKVFEVIMEPDPGLGIKTATCPICHSEVEIPARVIDSEGNYSIQCTKCKIPISGKVHPDVGTL